jgi:arylsulfatase A-like enzyme
MCSAARSTFFTSKFPAQHEVGLVLSDIENPILDAQTQLSPDLPNLATVLKGQGYDVSYFGKFHLSKTFTLDDGEIVYQDVSAYGFDDWQGPDSGQDMEPQNAGGGYADHDGAYTQQAVDWITNRAASGSTKPFCMVVSLVNPHDVLSYPKTYKEFGYDDSWLQGDIKDLPPTVDEILRKNYKPSVQTQWKVLQSYGQPMETDQAKLEYINFYGNLQKSVDSQMGQILQALGKTDNPANYSELLKDTMIVSTADHGEMGLSHGGLVQKMEVAYDEALKVPMVWSNPEYFKGAQTTDSLVSHVDFLPTLANYLGFDPSYIQKQDLRGVDYSKILNYASTHKNMTRAPEAQSSLLFTFDDIYDGQNPRLSFDGNYVHGLFPAANRIQALRTKDFKYARYYSGDKAYTPLNWQGEFYDLRKNGGDYYPNRNPRTGQLNVFKGAPLEYYNLDPKAEAQRVLDGKKPLASPAQKAAYAKMFDLLDQQIVERLDPLTGQPAIAPSVFVYQGGSMEGSVYNKGDNVSRLIPAQSGQDLELAFNTRTHQTYNIVYENADGSAYTSVVSNIAGTNGPVYQYLTGLPSSLSLDDISIEWVGGYVPLA